MDRLLALSASRHASHSGTLAGEGQAAAASRSPRDERLLPFPVPCCSRWPPGTFRLHALTRLPARQGSLHGAAPIHPSQQAGPSLPPSKQLGHLQRGALPQEQEEEVVASAWSELHAKNKTLKKEGAT